MSQPIKFSVGGTIVVLHKLSPVNAFHASKVTVSLAGMIPAAGVDVTFWVRMMRSPSAVPRRRRHSRR